MPKATINAKRNAGNGENSQNPIPHLRIVGIEQKRIGAAPNSIATMITTISFRYIGVFYRSLQEPGEGGALDFRRRLSGSPAVFRCGRFSTLRTACQIIERVE